MDISGEKENLSDSHLTLWLSLKPSALTGDHPPYSAEGGFKEREDISQKPACGEKLRECC